MIHPSAEVSGEAHIGEGTRIWNDAQVRDKARIGRNCNIGKGVYIDVGVEIGDNVKIQNGCTLGRGSRLESGVFLGPDVVLTNDRFPRSINRDGTVKKEGDWEVGQVRVGYGASLATRVIVMPNVMIGRFAMVGVGSVVTKNVFHHAFVLGYPARQLGYVCYCGRRLEGCEPADGGVEGLCRHCQQTLRIPHPVPGALDFSRESASCPEASSRPFAPCNLAAATTLGRIP